MKDDEFHGQGGSYEMDPRTGKRTLVHRTEPVAEAAAAVEPAPVKKTKQPQKDKD